MKMSRIIIPLVVALVLVATQSTEAQVVRYRAAGHGVYTPANFEYATAGRSVFGKLVGSGTAIPEPTSDPLVSNWSTDGEVQETYRDGSQIFFVGEGQVRTIPLFGDWNIAIWTGVFTPTRGNGRFEDVIGGRSHVVAVNFPFKLTDPEWFFVYKIRGRIVFDDD